MSKPLNQPISLVEILVWRTNWLIRNRGKYPDDKDCLKAMRRAKARKFSKRIDLIRKALVDVMEAGR